ncbi:DUF1697 domain-containing protein [Paracoccus onubensis]|uniref:DUF1697 domain-containing protein n=1 Tax=Paracoccus onubensis TaxID=1675788 RepID=UPI0027318AC5|nr:DUF1697 domain-containing protein [Paracoccus onubensis]MDP0927872.1 DUF1697 domain-containing protein [Paracoccus onubensis]
MKTLVALLRAVNVGGTGKLPMAALRMICEQAGFGNVRTYIQSGNVVFDTDLPDGTVKSDLERRLAEHMGKPVGVMIRDGAQMRSILERNPFPDAAPNKVSVLFLDHAAPDGIVTTAKRLADEEIVPNGTEVFIHYPSGMGRSRLGLPAMNDGTARNLNTVAKLAAMASEDARNLSR